MVRIFRDSRFVRSRLPSLVLGLLAATGCSAADETDSSEDVAVAQTTAPITFEEWKDRTRVSALGPEVYAVGDQGISPRGLVGDAEARRYYDSHVVRGGALTVDNGQLQVNEPPKPEIGAYPPGAVLKYCIDKPAMDNVLWRYQLPNSPKIYEFVDIAFGSAAAAWNTVAGEYDGVTMSGLSIQHAYERDGSCKPKANDDITWYITTYGQNTGPGARLDYLTFALGPKYFNGQPTGGDPSLRLFMLNDYIIQAFFDGAFKFQNEPPWKNLFTFNGLMLHAIGSALGFIAEDSRGGVPGDSGQQIWPAPCRDTSVGGIFLSDADPQSVMTHPAALAPFLGTDDLGFNRAPCAGKRPFDYAITYTDAMGAACQYRNNPEKDGDLDILYYCSGTAQQTLVSFTADPGCSPVPIGSTGNCGSIKDWDGAARSWGIAVINAAVQ